MNTIDADINLWNEFINGNTQSFTRLFRRHYASLYKYGIKIYPHHEIVEDSIQELFTEIWQSRNPAPVVSVRSYLLKALKYKLIKTIKKNSVISSGNDFNENLNFQISHETFLVDQQYSQEKAAKVIKALDQLSARQKEIIYLKFYQNLSYEEISEIMEINYQAARNLVCQAVKTLKNTFSIHTVKS